MTLKKTLAASALALSAFAVWTFGQALPGTPVPITNITVGASSVHLSWADSPGRSNHADLKLYASTNLTEGVWTEVTANLTKSLGDATVTTDAPATFFRLMDETPPPDPNAAIKQEINNTAEGGTFTADGRSWTILKKNVGANKDTLIISTHVHDYGTPWNTTATTAGGYAASYIKGFIDNQYASWTELQGIAVKPDISNWASINNTGEISLPMTGTASETLAGIQTTSVAFLLSTADVRGTYIVDYNPARISEDTAGTTRVWWLRTPYTSSNMWCVNTPGNCINLDASLTWLAVRPALWVRTSAF